MADLDLEEFLKDASVADLEWLDVNEVEYRKQDHLPKQNLDIKPDLEALWAREGESPTNYLIPNVVPVPNSGIKDPHTMGDMSQLHGPISTQADEIVRVARLAMMKSADLGRLRDELVKRFSMDSLRENRTVLASVLAERGLLGPYYIDSLDFPSCDQGKATGFVSKYASTAKFVLSKKACGGCSHAQKQADGSTVCGQFQKEIKVEVPYTDNLADEVVTKQAARGKTASGDSSAPRDRIRAAYLAGAQFNHSGVYGGQGVSREKQASIAPAEARTQLIQASSLVRKKQADEQNALDSKSVVAFLHREMVKGLTQQELASSLKIAFDKDLLSRTKQHWAPLFREAGLYGVVYTKQASFDECRDGADFLAKHNPQVRAIVAGEKCGSCVYNKVARCMMYGKPLVKQASEVITTETVETVLQEHKLAGRMQPWDVKTAAVWGEDAATALKAIHLAVKKQVAPQQASARMGMQQGFYGGRSIHNTSGLTRREILKQASQYLNEGLYGEDFMQAMQARFESRDLIAAKDDLKLVLAEQGLQGIYYVDPSVYDDYGSGCNEAQRLHGSRLVEYVKLGSKCGSCVHQVKTGHCSKINKPLVVEPPYANKKAQQREVLASGKSTEISYASLVNNATSMMEEFQMQNPMGVEVNAAVETADVSVELGTGKVKL